MKELVFYLITFILVYLFYIVFVLCRKSVLKKFADGKELKYLNIKYGVKTNEKNLKKIANLVFLVNSFILSTTVYVVCLFDNLFIEVIVGVLTLLLLILVFYHLLGSVLKKKQGGNKNV